MTSSGGTNGGEVRGGRYSELPARIASALILASFALYATWVGGRTFEFMILAGAILIFIEFHSIVKAGMPLRTAMFAAGFLLIFFASWFTGTIESGILVCAAGVVALAVWEYFIRKSAWAAGGILYAAIPFLALVVLRQGEQGMAIIVFLFGCVWGADTFAYFSGKTFGGPKLAPAISPNKTWSGFLGGLFGASLVSAVAIWWAGLSVTTGLICLAIVLAIVSQIGDLFESGIKRKFSVKDSGWIIPGHGGILDRIDGFIFAACAAFFLGFIVNGKKLFEDGMATTIFGLVGAL